MRLISFCAATLVAAACGIAHAAPVQWPSASGGNGHYYDFVSSPNIKWTDANAAAQAQTFNGVHGYLATITSQDEAVFVANNFPGQGGPFQDGWLGGFQDRTAPDYSEPAAGWRWVTGEPFIYTNWFTSGPVEPDDIGGNQDYIRSNVNWQWDDFQNDPFNPSVQYVSGYFVEYEVPEPSAFGSIVLAVLGCAFRAARGSQTRC